MGTYTDERTGREGIDLTCGIGTCAGAGSYEMEGACSNCHWSGPLRITRGHEAPGWFMGARCPRCGCNKVSAR